MSGCKKILNLSYDVIFDRRSIGSYLFGAATTALHSFFLYDVCDLYLELLKPVFGDDR